MNKSTIQTAYDHLSKYCAFHSKTDNMITITEWPNGDGVDIRIERTSLSNMGIDAVPLTHGELDALIAVSNFLRSSDNE